jgi:hypothetical protein
MSERRLMQQVMAIFSLFMVVFYTGVGVFLIWYTELSTIDKPVRVILGSAFLLYGLFRGFRAWGKIKEAYFTKNDDEKRDNHYPGGHIRRK